MRKPYRNRKNKKKWGTKAAAYAVALCLSVSGAPLNAAAEEIVDGIGQANETITGSYDVTEEDKKAETENGEEAEVDAGKSEGAGADEETVGTGTDNESGEDAGTDNENKGEAGVNNGNEDENDEKAEPDLEPGTGSETDDKADSDLESGVGSETGEKAETDLEPGAGSQPNEKTDSDLESETDTETDEKAEKDAEEGKLENDLPVETEKSKDELKTENISNAIQPQLLNMAEFKIPEPKADLEPLLMQDDDGSMKFSLSPFGYDVKGYSASDEIRSSLGGMEFGYCRMIRQVI
ncbi:hypothetical protein C0033_23320 [Clostridium sp. chh4-2]|uniref:hypothetical protein n=1 Tax=Clostridium sp. chh4-2 TaxID=2067550 RepID=UPI000CCF389B|nr:hypothetical protein [Clostridium sp. chh4-2]PNV59516.1 hypothetical protein C0033_23320 [Clostridium sp. chh4-2]